MGNNTNDPVLQKRSTAYSTNNTSHQRMMKFAFSKYLLPNFLITQNITALYKHHTCLKENSLVDRPQLVDTT